MAEEAAYHDRVVVTFYPEKSTNCGYCMHGVGIKNYLECDSLNGRQCEKLFNRGFRRCGNIFYQVCNETSCCAQYMLRCDASLFKLSKSQRIILKNFIKYLNVDVESVLAVQNKMHDTKASQIYDCVINDKLDSLPLNLKAKHNRFLNRLVYWKKKSLHIPPKLDLLNRQQCKTIDLDKCMEAVMNCSRFRVEWLRVVENESLESVAPNHTVFTLEDEFELYKLYQKELHDEIICELQAFSRFLCKNPFQAGVGHVVLFGQILQFGTYHCQYIIDDQLVAISVLDLIPTLISSCYFIYDPKHPLVKYSLGVFSSLFDIYTVKKCTSQPEMKYMSLGLYVPKCERMLYKAN